VNASAGSWLDAGYSWQLELSQLDITQLNKTVNIFVLLPGNHARPDHLHGSSNNGGTANNGLSQQAEVLMLRQDYCGSVAGFNDFEPLTHSHKQRPKPVPVAISINGCLKAAGINPDVEPVNSSNRSAGPIRPVVRPADFKLIALTVEGEDVSSRFNFGPVAVRWMLPVTQQMPAAVEAPSGVVNVASKMPALSGLLKEGTPVSGVVMGSFS
jgi:hypothetical protein